MTKLLTVADCLHAIEQELRLLEWWTHSAPDEQALSSPEPFCVDCLAFEQWLQWVMLPRMRALLDSGAELPARSAMAEMAEMVYAELPGKTAALRRALKQLDRLLTQAG